MIQWWGYKHINGTYHLKRYLDDQEDLKEAINSPFVKMISDVFYAKNREEALTILKKDLEND